MKILDYNIKLTDQQITEIINVIQRQYPEVYARIHNDAYHAVEQDHYCDECGYPHTGHCHDEY